MMLRLVVAIIVSIVFLVVPIIVVVILRVSVVLLVVMKEIVILRFGGMILWVVMMKMEKIFSQRVLFNVPRITMLVFPLMTIVPKVWNQMATLSFLILTRRLIPAMAMIVFL